MTPQDLLLTTIITSASDPMTALPMLKVPSSLLSPTPTNSTRLSVGKVSLIVLWALFYFRLWQISIWQILLSTLDPMQVGQCPRNIVGFYLYILLQFIAWNVSWTFAELYIQKIRIFFRISHQVNQSYPSYWLCCVLSGLIFGTFRHHFSLYNCHHILQIRV